MSSLPTADEIARDARWLVQALDPAARQVRLVAMSPESYRSASFLDERIFQQPQQAHIRPWDEVAAAIAAGSRQDAHWIFHIGHVGSTLIARLLGEFEGLLSVREPHVLRDVAFLRPEIRSQYVPTLRKLLSRSFHPGQTALVKATSFVSEIAPELVPAGGRALFMFSTPRAYIASILAGESSRQELSYFAEFRRQRLAKRGIVLADAAPREAHLAALAWACEMTTLQSAAEEMSDRQILWADFDRMLEDMVAALTAAARHFGLEPSPEQVDEIAKGPLLRRYSKALEYDYSPSLRRDLIEATLDQHRADIDTALALLHRGAEKVPLLARAVERATAES